MIFFKVKRYFHLSRIKGSGFIEFVKGQDYFIEELRNGNLDSHCCNTDVNAKVNFLATGGWIEECYTPACSTTISELVNTLLLARIGNV